MSRLLVAGAGPDLRSHLHVRGPRPD
ncbi:MAG: hypothetical protein JWL64_1404, partial [Frankiales bacterium]|nr:hypothetical protein [Frankiales bacterium]